MFSAQKLSQKGTLTVVLVCGLLPQSLARAEMKRLGSGINSSADDLTDQQSVDAYEKSSSTNMSSFKSHAITAGVSVAAMIILAGVGKSGAAKHAVAEDFLRAYNEVLHRERTINMRVNIATIEKNLLQIRQLEEEIEKIRHAADSVQRSVEIELFHNQLAKAKGVVSGLTGVHSPEAQQAYLEIKKVELGKAERVFGKNATEQLSAARARLYTLNQRLIGNAVDELQVLEAQRPIRPRTNVVSSAKPSTVKLADLHLQRAKLTTKLGAIGMTGAALTSVIAIVSAPTGTQVAKNLQEERIETLKHVAEDAKQSEAPADEEPTVIAVGD